ncbi:MAG: ScpA family protein [Rhodospirillales bacterium]|nr:ScpA family protein [Rhodospirillales bacterium]
MADLRPFEDDAGGRSAAPPGPEAAGDEPRLIVSLDGFEGPLDLLLALARTQKVDLARISILALAEQYLAYVEQARRLSIELAAGYLVMAAWLAYLKSRLLLPDEEPDDEEPSGPEMAAALALRLRRLAAMRDAAAALMDRPQLGRDVFAAGKTEGLPVREKALHESTLNELLRAYAAHRIRRKPRGLLIELGAYHSIEDAYRRMSQLLGSTPEWETLARFLPRGSGPESEAVARSGLASTLAASLELAREGRLQIRQLEPFGPIYLRRRREEP